MSVPQRFIVVTAFIFFGSVVIGSVLTSPTFFDVAVAYEKPNEVIITADAAPIETLEDAAAGQAASFDDEEGTEVIAEEAIISEEVERQPLSLGSVPDVPFFSQFTDITAPSWKKVGCGIASLAMLIEYYESNSVAVDTLLEEGITAGAYLDNAGWTYAGLIDIAGEYGLVGKTHDHAGLSVDEAFDRLLEDLQEGPVMASVHYTFQKSNPIPHLVVINGVEGDSIVYNDPAEDNGGGSVSIDQFKSAWKKRYIEFRPL